MENDTPDQPTPWYIGQHESDRGMPVSDKLLRDAQDAGYDMLTSPITTPHFRTSVLNLVATYYKTAGTHPLAEDLPIPLVPALKPIDSTLIPSDTISQLLITTSAWIDLASPDPVIANVSRQVFTLEVAYAAFCGVQHIIVHGPTPGDGAIIQQFSRAMQEAIAVGPYVQFHLLMPLGASGHGSKVALDTEILTAFARTDRRGEKRMLSEWSSWEAWHAIRQFCQYSGKLTLALTIPRHLPAAHVLSRWASEPLRLIFIPTSSFKLNKYQPIIPRATQTLLYRFMRLKSSPWILLGDVGSIISPQAMSTLDPGSSTSSSVDAWPSLSDAGLTPEQKKAAQKVAEINARVAQDPTPHLTCMRHLQKHQPPRPLLDRFGAGYQDYLQAPLQPLADNLESITYEVFEKDPIKYEWYERAIHSALTDWSTEEKPTSSKDGKVVIAVVGSGRGPLVTRALQASASSGVDVEVWAIEKNPNAYVLLQRHNEFEWGRRVNVVKTDMRAWKGPTLEDGTFGHVDILVSELLGSFADNELSPECLDGVQHVLNPEYGISIPASYTAHLTPISSPKLHADLLHKAVADKDVFDLPYVVMLHQLDYLSTLCSKPADPGNAEPIVRPNVQTCWEFKHPISPTILAQSALRRGGSAAGGFGGTHGGDGANEHNTRFCHLTFHVPNRGTCHGLAGYFETVLYTSSDVDDSGADLDAQGLEPDFPLLKTELSTNPVTMDQKSKDMISWFPIYFPLRTPVGFPDRAEIEVSMWRVTDDRKVWYEWCVEAFMRLDGGDKVRVGGGELQSSRKNGCLM